MRRAAHGPDGAAPGRPRPGVAARAFARHKQSPRLFVPGLTPAPTGRPVGAVTPHSIAPTAGRTAQAGDSCAAGGARRDHAHLLGQAGVKAHEFASGAVTLIQPFESAANPNVHLHCQVLVGVYRRGTNSAPEFVKAPAAVRCSAQDRQALEQRCRYITRPPCRPRTAQTATAPEKDAFRLRCQRSTDRAAFKDRFKRSRAPCSAVLGCHGDGKRAFEKPFLRPSTLARTMSTRAPKSCRPK